MSPSPTTTGSKVPPLIETISQSHRISYSVGRGEEGVLTFEPYKSVLLPLWRFRTVEAARKSAAGLWDRFLEFEEQGDFVGMDMARKFIQMGMTRAKRYANYRGGRKYRSSGSGRAAGDEDGDSGKREKKEKLPKSEAHRGRAEKEAASLVFKEFWERCRQHDGYRLLKEEFVREKREYEKYPKQPR